MNFEATLSQAASGRLYPSVILHGATVAERQRSAVALGRAALCEREPGERPCGACRHCRRVVWPGSDEHVFHPDFAVLERDLRTATSVDATKTFLQGAQFTPFEARGQVFVVADAASLSGEAANALLKNLEEPHLSAPRNFLLLAPSQLDLLPTLRSRSLSVYLGGGERPDAEAVESRARDFRAALDAFHRGRNEAELLGAAAVLEDIGGWRDARAQAPWEEAAAVVLATARDADLEPGVERRLLALAEDLLAAFRTRMRGIPATRILDGLIHRHLA